MDCMHLKEGDIVYIQSRNEIFKTTVARITPKQLVVELNDYKYRREDGEEVGSDVWSYYTLLLPDEKIEKQWKLQQALYTVKNQIFNLREIKIKKINDISKLQEAHDLLSKIIVILSNP